MASMIGALSVGECQGFPCVGHSWLSRCRPADPCHRIAAWLIDAVRH